MKKLIAVSALAVAAAVSVAGCKSTDSAKVTSSQSAEASAAAQDARALAGNTVLDCLPKDKQTEANLIQIAVSKTQRDKLASCLRIPKANRKPFATAVAESALNAYQIGDFKTKSGRTEWTEEVLPVVVEKYQAK